MSLFCFLILYFIQTKKGGGDPSSLLPTVVFFPEVGQGKGNECTMSKTSGVTIHEALLLCDSQSLIKSLFFLGELKCAIDRDFY